MKTVAIHIGAHKTASSLLKKVLESVGSTLKEAGAVYDGMWHLGKELNDNSPLPPQKLEEFKFIFKQRLSSMKANLIILSSEEFAGNVSKSYENAAAIAKNLAYIFEGHKVIISAAVRRQDTFFESVYGQTVKIHNALPFEVWKEKQELKKLHWDKFISAYTDVFGKENVRVFPYELILSDPSAFVSQFLSSLTLEGKVSIDQLPIINPGLSKKGIEIFRRCNEIAHMLDDQERKSIRKFLEENFPNNPNNREGFFTDTERCDLLKHYSNSNKILFETHMTTFDPNYYTDR